MSRRKDSSQDEPPKVSGRLKAERIQGSLEAERIQSTLSATAEGQGTVFQESFLGRFRDPEPADALRQMAGLALLLAHRAGLLEAREGPVSVGELAGAARDLRRLARLFQTLVDGAAEAGGARGTRLGARAKRWARHTEDLAQEIDTEIAEKDRG